MNGKFSRTMKEIGQIAWLFGKVIVVAVGGAVLGVAGIVGMWLLGPIIAAVLIGLPLWFVWTALAPLYIEKLSPELANISYLHVAMIVASVVLLKRLILFKNTVQISKGKK